MEQENDLSKKEELQKILTFIRQMENIVRTSSNPGQVDRVRKEIVKFRIKLKELAPQIDIERTSLDEIAKQLGLVSSREASRSYTSQTQAKNSSAAPSGGSMELIESTPILRASPHSSDAEVNFLATVLLTIQKEYWPVLSEQHTKLDFSHASVRDTVRNRLDNAMRNMKVLAETIEEYSLAEKQDFREQLLKMKNKQTRIFLMETNDVLKEINDFLKKLADDINNNGNVIVNKGDIIEFNPRFEDAVKLQGKTVSYGLTEFSMFVTQAIRKLNLPQLKQ